MRRRGRRRWAENSVAVTAIRLNGRGGHAPAEKVGGAHAHSAKVGDRGGGGATQWLREWY